MVLEAMRNRLICWRLKRGKSSRFSVQFFTNTLTGTQKRQITNSLKQLHKKHPNTSRWTLVIPKNLTPAELRWVDNLGKDYPDMLLDLWSYSKIKDLLIKHYRLYYDYFPIPEHVRIEIDRHLNDLKRDVVSPLIKSLQNSNLEGIKAITKTELCKDMLLCHYPQDGVKLHAFIESSNSIESQSSALYSCIKTLLRKYLNANTIKYRESDGTEYNIADSIPVEQFAERLWPIIESNSYSDDKISIDKGYPEMLRIRIYSTFGQGIMYQCFPS